MKHRISLFLLLLITLVLLFLPTPEGLVPYAWRFFAVFAGAIIGLILEPLPGAVVGLTAVVIITLGSEWLLSNPEQQAAANFNLPGMSFKWAVSGFSNSTVWLIFRPSCSPPAMKKRDSAAGWRCCWSNISVGAL